MPTYVGARERAGWGALPQCLPVGRATRVLRRDGQQARVRPLLPINNNGKGADWNSSQAEALFAYSKQKGYSPATTMWGFELGEELTKFKVGTGAFHGYTASYRRGAKLLTSIFGTGSAARPKLMGPCPGMSLGGTLHSGRVL